MMINKKNKSYKITLDPIHQQLLEELASQYNITKSELICKLLETVNGKKSFYIKIGFFNQNPTQEKVKSTPIADEQSFEELINELAKDD